MRKKVLTIKKPSDKVLRFYFFYSRKLMSALQFFDVPLKINRLIFFSRTAPNNLQVTRESEETDFRDLIMGNIDEFLGENQEIGIFFNENNLIERAFNDVNEKLKEFINFKMLSGTELNQEWIYDVAKLMTETACKVIFLEAMRNADPLTGLPNRRAFEARLQEELARSQKSGPLSLLICDLDKFKWVNDKYGHLAGDQVLKELADCFRSVGAECVLRDSDFIARMGGDELYLLLPGTDAEGACVVAHRISSAIKNKNFLVGHNGNAEAIQLTSSIGVSEYYGNFDDPDGSKMINRADECLYIMKGEKPDKKGEVKERRGNIACDGLIISPDDIYRIIKKNPELNLGDMDIRGRIDNLLS